jgi:peptidoglycan/xylan/chitin deacetylase (PgdA/CDA1 family)
VRLDRAASRFVVEPILRAGILTVQPAVPILMYHSISDDDEHHVRPYYRLTTSPGRFRDQMRWLSEAGYSVIHLTEALRRLADQTLPKERYAVLTFDDGFRDFLSHAWPVLSDHGFEATVFLPTGFIGRSRKSFNGRECLTWGEARELSLRGVCFGAHTVRHSTLYRLSWKEVRHELREARSQIEQEIYTPATTFAYPYAFPREDREFVERFTGELRDSGYTAAVTTMVGRAQPGSDPLCLKRLPVNEHDDEQFFKGKLSGAYDWFGNAQAIFRHTKKHYAAVRGLWCAK